MFLMTDALFYTCGHAPEKGRGLGLSQEEDAQGRTSPLTAPRDPPEDSGARWRRWLWTTTPRTTEP